MTAALNEVYGIPSFAIRGEHATYYRHIHRVLDVERGVAHNARGMVVEGGIPWGNDQQYEMPDGRRIRVLTEGRLVNLGAAGATRPR